MDVIVAIVPSESIEHTETTSEKSGDVELRVCVWWRRVIG